MDSGFDLYYYGARYYDANIGRFISADTVVSKHWNPQELNRYSYALNNPLRYIDPSGHQVEAGSITVTNYAGLDSVSISTTMLGVSSFVNDPSNAAIVAQLQALVNASDNAVVAGSVITSTAQNPNTVIVTGASAAAALPKTGVAGVAGVGVGGQQGQQTVQVDTTIIGLDALAVIGDAISFIPTPPTIIGGYLVSAGASFAGLKLTIKARERREAEGLEPAFHLDESVSFVTFATGLIPRWGIIPAIIQLGYDLVRPQWGR